MYGTPHPGSDQPFVRHADFDVRDTAARYFSDSYSTDPTVMPLVIEAWEKYGVEGGGFSAAFRYRNLAQTADTVAWLTAAVGRETGRERNELANTLVAADVTLLRAHEGKVQGAVAFDPTHPARLTARLDLATGDADRLWQRLAELCERSKDEEDAYSRTWPATSPCGPNRHPSSLVYHRFHFAPIELGNVRVACGNETRESTRRAGMGVARDFGPSWRAGGVSPLFLRETITNRGPTPPARQNQSPHPAGIDTAGRGEFGLSPTRAGGIRL